MSKREWTKKLIWLLAYGMRSALLARPADYSSPNDIIIQQQSVDIGVSPSTHFQQPAGGIALNPIDSVQAISENLGCLATTDYTILVNPAGIFSESNAEQHHCINSNY